MKSQRLLKLQVGTITTLVLYVMLVTYMILNLPRGPHWNNYQAERAIQSANSMEELQNDLRSAVSSLSTFRHSINKLLLTFFVASVGTVAFLGWSLFMVGRVKSEDSIDRAA